MEKNSRLEEKINDFAKKLKAKRAKYSQWV